MPRDRGAKVVNEEVVSMHVQRSLITCHQLAVQPIDTLAGQSISAIDLEANGFFSEIPPEVVDEAGSPVTVTQTAQALPQMNGSGMVRNLREAMSLTGTAADGLEAAL